MNVLLVEDDERIIEFVLRGLHAEGYHVDVARSGRDALRRAVAPACQLIILDLLLPDLDGREVCRQLRAASVAIPILMLTALDSLFVGLRMDADDYLAKPFALEESVARVQALARRGPVYRGEPPELRVHDLVLDRAPARSAAASA
jgi:DNA-binding response OmpR family regulator